MKLFDEILMFENDTQTKSYNQNNCTLRFLASMVWTLMLTRKGLISDLPNNKYYRHRTQSNIKNLRSLFADSRYPPTNPAWGDEKTLCSLNRGAKSVSPSPAGDYIVH